MFSIERFTPLVECRDIVDADDKCTFITRTPDCANGAALFDYLRFLYCRDSPSFFDAGVALLVIWMLFMFAGLAAAANNYFCPALHIISDKLHLSHNVAGVTLLALGNGAPDIFSCMAAVSQGRAGLVFGELFGAGIFVTTVVAGAISITQPFHVMERPFLRDCVFYLAAVYFVYWVFDHGRVEVGHAVGFIVLYVVYVLVVIVGRICNARLKTKPEHEDEREEVNENQVEVGHIEISCPHCDAADACDRHEQLIAALATPADDDSALGLRQSMADEWRDLLVNLWPITYQQWTGQKWYLKMATGLQVPMELVFRLSIPVFDESHPLGGWCRSLQCLQMTITPPFFIYAIGYGGVRISKLVPLPLLVLPVGCALALLLAIFTRRTKRPAWHSLFAVLSFVNSVVWINLIVNEILAVLFVFGVVFRLSDAVLGLTILAWGNSVQDLVADISVTRLNAPRMGFSACYGAPLLNTLLGLGVPFVIACGRLGGEAIPVSFPHLSQLMVIFLLASLISVFVYLPMCQFRADRKMALILFSIYFIFVTLAVLQEAGLVWPDSL